MPSGLFLNIGIPLDFYSLSSMANQYTFDR